tara:strand:+ start:1594 stop:1770 length:177 start_codon:yes stop_codon:yes gene_type:complete
VSDELQGSSHKERQQRQRQNEAKDEMQECRLSEPPQAEHEGTGPLAAGVKTIPSSLIP